MMLEAPATHEHKIPAYLHFHERVFMHIFHITCSYCSTCLFLFFIVCKCGLSRICHYDSGMRCGADRFSREL